MSFLRSAANQWQKVFSTRRDGVNALARTWVPETRKNTTTKSLEEPLPTEKDKQTNTSKETSSSTSAAKSKKASVHIPPWMPKPALQSSGPSQLAGHPEGTKTAQPSKQSPTWVNNQLSLRLEELYQLHEQQRRALGVVDSESSISTLSRSDGVPENTTVLNAEKSVEENLSKPDLKSMNLLMNTQTQPMNGTHVSSGFNHDVEHAPLLSGHIVIQHAKDLVPQYGFLGCVGDGNHEGIEAKVFQNTNAPFSTFICGIQGSGKSHTTACMIENALISSKQLGHLQSPASALVFNYGKWNSGSANSNISESAYLATPDPAFPDHRVKKVTVLISPTNSAVKKQYERLPHVRVIPFKIHAKALNIETMRMLMGVDDKTVPLYMTKVESIVRDLARKSKDGCLDYKLFKDHLAREDLDARQRKILRMRLDMLESFMDLQGNATEPKFRPGELTIIDLTDPFITPDTACILFKLVLDSFLQTSVKGKMVVLDEAHKYMLNTSASRFLTDRLIEIVRLQRHEGARVIISTQEPTVSTDLIALCSVTIMHRFTSPAWYNALKKHINVLEVDDKEKKKQIEGLQTGEALVYAPNAVLGKKGDGSLIKAPGRLLQLNIRKRVTADGGKSIMAV